MLEGKDFEFISDRSDLLRHLTRSKNEGTAIGINSPVLGTRTIVTCVEEIILDGEIVVTLKPFDATGRILNRCRLKLSEINSVLPFSSDFTNPFHKSTKFQGSV
jgi:hypothetical protein